MRRTLTACALASLLYALLISGGTIAAIAEHRASPVQMGIDSVAADEAHYFALMQSAAHGRWLMGNASLKEWELSSGNVIFGPVLQGAILRWTGLPLSVVIWSGDVLFVALAMFLLCLTLLRFVGTAEAVCIAILLMNTVGLGWLRSVNPQITLGLFALYLLTFLRKDDRRNGLLLRGAVIAILCFVQVQMAFYCVIAEALLTLLRILKNRDEWKKALFDACVVAVPVACAMAAVLLLSLHADALALADSRRRFGLIATRLPADPAFQTMLLLAATCVFVAWKQAKESKTLLLRIEVLLLSGLCVLNQSMLHGVDAIFGLYYHSALTILTGMAFWIASAKLVKKPILRPILAVLTLASVSMLAAQVIQGNNVQREAAKAFAESKVMDVLAALNAESGRFVVLAPFEIGNLVPVYTDDTVEFNRYSRFGIATDSDLADRFVLYRSLFPHSDPLIDDPTHSLVLGQYAGNSAARKREACRILSFLRGEKNDCVVTIRSQIYHQELVAKLDDRHTPDQRKLMREFGVDRFVSKDPIPKTLRSFCTEKASVGDWKIFACKP